MKTATRLFLAAFVLVLSVAPCLAEKPDAKATPVAVPFELLKTRHMAVQIKVNGKGPYRVIFDTGAPVTVLNSKIAKAAGLLGKNGGGGLGGFSLFGPAAQVKVDTLEVGDLKAEKVGAIIMDHPTVEAVSQILGPLDGIVGFPFFARYRMTIDYQAKELTFVPNGYDPPDVIQAMLTTLLHRPRDGQQPKRVQGAAGLWGLMVDKADSDEEAGVTIRTVLKGSAAERAGLQPGDRLLTLDGRWTDTLADCHEAARHVPPGTAAKVVVRRDGKEIDCMVEPSAGL